jgi:peptidoglycan/xylan/chitin deacetylase (PgdA/CDA1 family)/GNAT superfamily N-acetyltransferase
VPVRHRAPLSLTFDNLGEATALELGEWPARKPLGHHFSVTRALPRVLDLLQETGHRATFFVEGINTELYPDALAEIAQRGHEVAYHGWRHEPWADLDPDTERDLLQRGIEAFDGPLGFRPPGGDVTPHTAGLLGELGYAYVSAAAPVPGVVSFPFRWELVDAYYYLQRFGHEGPPSMLREAIERAHAGDIVVFHPFLTDPGERLELIRDVLTDLPPSTPLGERPRIVPWGEDDEPLLHGLLGDPAMMVHLGGPESPEKIAERQARYAKPDSKQFKIVVAGEGVGWVGYWERDDVYEIGWSVLPGHQGRGIARQATRQAIDRARPDGKDIHAYPGADNAASNALCRTLGFTLLEAREFEYPKGHFMLCNDWRLAAYE